MRLVQQISAESVWEFKLVYGNCYVYEGCGYKDFILAEDVSCELLMLQLLVLVL